MSVSDGSTNQATDPDSQSVDNGAAQTADDPAPQTVADWTWHAVN